MSENNGIDKYVEELPQKLDAKKQISLFKLILKYCPNTVHKLCKKIYGSKYGWKEIYKERKWYTSIINYMVKNEIMITEKIEDQTYHTVTNEYIKYFISPKSASYILSNAEEHIKLYYETAEQFLIQAKLYDNKGNEIIQKETIDKKKLNKKTKKILTIISLFFMLVCLLFFVIMASKYGLKQYIPILSTSCLFTISVIIFLDNTDKK